MATKKKRGSQQIPLFDAPRYGWKSVREAKHGDSIVVAGQETLLTAVRQQEGCWWVSYSHPMTGIKTEELYGASDFVFMRLPRESE